MAVELPEKNGEAERRWMNRWLKGYRGLRRIFPILGEVQFATRREWERYFKYGDFRAGEVSEKAVERWALLLCRGVQFGPADGLRSRCLARHLACRETRSFLPAGLRTRMPA